MFGMELEMLYIHFNVNSMDNSKMIKIKTKILIQQFFYIENIFSPENQ